MIYFFQHYTLIIFFLFSTLLAFILVILSYVLSNKVYDFEKNTSYECGFEPFGEARCSFNIQYYVVGILFLIFDLEIAFLIPWAISFGNLGIFSFWIMSIFLLILTLGFVYEWKKGALNWL